MGDYSYTYGYPMYDPYAPTPDTPTPLPNPAGVTQAPMQMPQVPNVMTGLNSFVDSLFGGSRNAAGSFDPNKVSVPGAAVGKGAGPGNAQPSNPNAWMDKYGFDPETRKMMEFQQELAQRQADVYRRNKPQLGGMEMFGRGLQAMALPVMMLSKNPKVWDIANSSYGKLNDSIDSDKKRRSAWDEKIAEMEAGAIGSGGDMAVKMMMKQREKRDEATLKASQILTAIDSDPEASDAEFEQTKQSLAAQLEGQGYRVEANAIRNRPRSRAASAAPQQSQPAQRQPSGDMMLAPEAVYPGSGTAPTHRVDVPAAADPGGTGAAQTSSGMYMTPPEIKALYRRAQMLSGYDKELGKQALERARIADRATAQAWQQSQSARHGRYGLVPQKLLDENNEFGGLAVVGNDGTSKLVEPPKGKKFADPSVIAGQTAEEKKAGDMRGEARQNLPKVIEQAGRNASIVDQLYNHPALARSTGPIQQYTANLSEEAQEFAGLWDQLQGDLFLGAFTQLRGGGQITEAEGQKATKARSALRLGMGTSTFRKHLDILRMVTHNSVIRAKIDAGELPASARSQLYNMEDDNPGGDARMSTGSEGRTSVRRRYNPTTGELEEAN